MNLQPWRWVVSTRSAARSVGRSECAGPSRLADQSAGCGSASLSWTAPYHGPLRGGS